MTRTGIPGRAKALQENYRVNQALRRNGKIQSCEPCRKRKLRCDHILPTCGRCARRNRTEQCIYHPAPLTKQKQSNGDSETSPANNVLLTPQSASETIEELRGVNSSPLDNSILPISSNRSSHESSPTYTDPKTSNHGFLGPTSYSAILSENQRTLGLGNDDHGSCWSAHFQVTKDRIQKGAEALSLLRDASLITKFIDRWFTICDGVTIPENIMKPWISEMYSVHKRAFKSNDIAHLEQLSEKIWINTLKPLKFNNKTTPAEWTALSTGENLRWEVIALILTHAALLNLSLLDLDPLFTSQPGPRFDRQGFAAKACEAAENCISFCRETETLNDLFVCALFERGDLLSRIKGKLSYASWQSFGELMSALVMMGFHQEIKEDENTPWFLVQFRRILFIFSFAADKSLSAFLGRPPRLSQKYCMLQLPVDLEDWQILLEGRELEAALADILTSGWNTSGKISRATSARHYALNACVKEDILELSLGISCDRLEERAEQIQKRSEQNWNNLPAKLRRDDDSSWDNKICVMRMLMKVFMRVEYLNQGFLIQRTLVRRGGTDTSKLRDYAQKLLRNIMLCIQNRESFLDTQLDFALIMHTYGLPSAAVLALELLRQEQGLLVSGTPLQRSELIQDLSVFTACLGSMRLEGAVLAVCEHGKRFLKKILDLILSPTLIQAPPVTGDETNSATEQLRSTSDLFSLSDGEFMSWLDSLNIDSMIAMPFNPPTL